MQPCGDGGLPTKGVSGPEGGDQSVLDSVRGFLAVTQSAQGYGPQPVAVTSYKLTEGVWVAGDMGSQEICIAQWPGWIGSHSPLPIAP